MNSRQRRGLVLLLVSVLCAVAAFAGVLALIRSVTSKVGPETTAYELAREVPAERALSSADVTAVALPRRYLPRTAVTSLDQLRGRVAGGALHQGSLLQSDMLARRPGLRAGEQQLTVLVDGTAGITGSVAPGSRVNVYATFKGDAASGRKGGTPDESKVVVAGARVLKVGAPARADGGDSLRSPDSSAGQGGGVPVTFALGTRDAQRITYAESFAEHLRLALVAPGDGAAISGRDRTYTLAGDK